MKKRKEKRREEKKVRCAAGIIGYDKNDSNSDIKNIIGIDINTKNARIKDEIKHFQ